MTSVAEEKFKYHVMIALMLCWGNGSGGDREKGIRALNLVGQDRSEAKRKTN